MNSLPLHIDLLRNMGLGARRSPMAGQNVAAQALVFLGFALIAVYLVAVGITLGLAAAGGNVAFVFAFMQLMLTFDFVLRLGLQQTPAVAIKPYLLLPIKRGHVANCFLIRTLAGGISCIWIFLFLPYAIICFCGGLGFLASVALFAVCMILVAANGLWYLLCRTLACRNAAYWTVPAVAYCAADGLSLAYFMKDASAIATVCDHAFTPLAAAVYVAVFVALFAAARKTLLRCAADEVAKTDTASNKRRLSLGALDSMGCIGEYLKLEVRSAMRNKMVRGNFISGAVSVALLCVSTTFTDVYEGDLMHNMWCLYCFVIFGAVNLVKVMGVEGNYMDLLMTQRENIFMLLRAKYYFYCAVLALPLAILAPAIIAGKLSPLMVAAYVLTTSGTEYFLLFQLAVYNRQTIPLTQGVTGKANLNNSTQIVTNLVALFAPVALTLLLTCVFSSTAAYATMGALGLALTLTHKIWLRNVYVRMMRRKYENIEGFHATMAH